MTAISNFSTRSVTVLLIGCSGLALATPALANDVLFSTAEVRPQTGQRTNQLAGLTQIALTGGGTASVVDAADYTVNADGSIDLYAGSLTVAGTAGREIVVRMPDGLEGRVTAGNSAANFTVGDNGEASGHALTGTVQIGRGGNLMRYDAGDMWRASADGSPRRVVANDAVPQPDAGMGGGGGAVLAIGGDAGPSGAALNGIPVTLGDALAGAGASSDIVAAGRRVELAVANPTLEAFPSGDFGLLIAAAAQLEGSFGGQPFVGAQADVIRTYLRFLASGGSGAEFLTAYSGFAIGYLDLVRAGGVPSGFASGVASADDIDAYLAFIARTGAISGLAARDRALADAYLAFLASGGNRDAFAASFTNLTEAYFAFVRSGGAPSTFTGASQDALAQSIAFLQQSGLVVQLSAADQALVAAFLANGGLAFTTQFETALNDYFAFLASGRLPSEYTALDQATLRAYLETLANTGLLQTVLAERAEFYASYLAFLRAGGNVDAFAALPANIFAGYAVQLDSYFAFLAAGNLPSQFTGADAAQLQAFIAQLQAAGALDRFLGVNQAAFFASFSQFVAAGGDFDAFAGLNANIFAGYALDLSAYYEYLLAGGVPSAYTVLSQDTIAQYLAALETVGATDGFLADLAAFYRAYFVFVSGGGNPDNFAGLPVPPDFPAFASALNAYAAFLAANGLPSGYTADDLSSLQAFFDALVQSGRANDLLGANADLLSRYFAFLANGGSVDGFAGLPVYLDYVAALNAYFDFLAAGNLPSAYTVLDQATIAAYLDALAALQGGIGGFADLNSFFLAYFDFIRGGNNPDLFAGLPGNTGGNGGGGGQGPSGLQYAGGFNDPQPNIAYAGNGFSGQGTNVTPLLARFNGFASASITDQGALQSYGGLISGNGSAAVTDVSGDANLLIGRFTDGTFVNRGLNVNLSANQGFHYLLARDITTALTLPSGVIEYDLLAATQATLFSGATAPGTFQANLAVEFSGPRLRFGIDGSITMPGANGFVYSFSTPGGSANPNANPSSIVIIDGGLNFSASGSTNEAVQRAGAINFQGFLGDPSANRFGVTYLASLSGSDHISGAAIFGRADQTGSGGGTGSSNTGTVVSNQLVAYAGADVGIDMRERAEVTYNAAGAPVGYIWQLNDFTAENERPTIGTATAMEAGSRGDGLIGWARWADGQGGGRYFGDTDGFTLPANGGFHIVAVDPATDLPGGGQIIYQLAGATSPTVQDASLTPGTFTGTMAIAFGAIPTADFNFTVGIGGTNYNFGASGRPIETSGDFANQFGANGMAVNGTGSVCPTGACQATMRGALGGVGATAVGVSYNFAETGNENLRTYGAAAFVAPGVGASGFDGTLISSAIPPSVSASAMVDWSRWSAAPENRPSAISALGGLADLVPPGVAAADALEASANFSQDRDLAVREAERLMGGMIRFGTEASVPR